VHDRRDLTGSPMASARGWRVSRPQWLQSTLFCRDTTREEGTRSEEMRTHEGRRRVEDSAVLAHRFDDGDAMMAAT
jgi:hypothetical protein